MQQQNFITVSDKKDNLCCINYSWQATHPGPYDFYKGIILDDKNTIVARSFTWSPTVVSDNLPQDNSVYTRLYESTILRFYRYKGVPRISTHKRVDITEIKSRVKNNRTFFELVQDAIKSWDYSANKVELGDEMLSEYTPRNWEDLCIEGWCNVFILVDESNSLTDINEYDKDVYLLQNEDKQEKFVDSSPRLIHVMSLRVDGDKMKSQLDFPTVYYDQPKNNYIGYRLNVPHVKIITKSDAEIILKNGGAVIGFDKEKPDETVKYISEEYNEKLRLVDENFNRVQRWHELMDENPEDAEMLLKVLPKYERKQYTKEYMLDVNKKYNLVTASFLAPYLIRRLNNEYTPLDKKLYDLIKVAFVESFEKLRKSKTRSLMDAQSLILNELSKLKYEAQHSAHSCVLKIRRQETQ